MEAQLRMLNGKILVKVSGDTQVELFAQIAAVQEVFDAESKCGMCGGTDLRLNHRQPQGFDYYELQCCNYACGARFQFGQNAGALKGNLFPKREDGQGGWSIYQANNQGGYDREPEPQQQRRTAPPARNAGPPPRDPNSW